MSTTTKNAAAPLKAIYLDHAATTPCDPRVVEALLPISQLDK